MIKIDVSNKTEPALRGRSNTGEKLMLYGLLGFLGAGKTTTLQQILLYCREVGVRPGLLINDFGEVNIDSLILRETGLSLEELTGGCVCCGTSFELMAAAVHMSKDPKVDLLLLEASGLAEPDALLDQLSDPMLWPLCRVGGLISVVDTTRWSMLASILPLVKRDVQFADVILVNKSEAVSAEELAQVEAEVRETNSHAPQFRAENGKPLAGFEAVFRELQDASQFHAATGRRQRSHESFHSFTIETEKAIDRAALENFLQKLPPELYRAKGLVKIEGEELPVLFQYVGSLNGAPSVAIKPYLVTPDKVAEYQAVFIGQNLDKAVISQQWAEISS